MSNGSYRRISGGCFYFEARTLDYHAARVNCESKFFGNGRLFEPRILDMNEKVYKIAREIFKQEPRLWIGVNALVEQRKYTYDKSGLPVSIGKSKF